MRNPTEIADHLHTSDPSILKTGAVQYNILEERETYKYTVDVKKNFP